MGSDSIPLWIIFAICVIGGAYFAAAESAFSAVNKIKIKSLADDGKKSAKGALAILNNFEKALTTLLIGNNVTKIAGASVFTVLATRIFSELGKSETYLESFEFSIICSVMSTVIIFLFSEMIPKSFANDRSQTVSLFFQGSLRLLMKLLFPISALFNLISNGAKKLFTKGEAEPSITEDELLRAVGYEVEQCRDGEKQLHQKSERSLEEERNRLASVIRKALGYHLAEEEDDDRTQNRTDHRKLEGLKIGLALSKRRENIGRKNGKHRRTCYFGDVITNQKRRQCLLKIIENGERSFCTLFAVVGQSLDLNFVNGRKSALSRRKISASDNADYKDNP